MLNCPLVWCVSVMCHSRSSVAPVGSVSVSKVVPVTVTKTSVSTCRSYGDPHISTFDRMSYGFQSPGVWEEG